MNLHEITEKDIKNIADSTVILNRGKKYYFSGMVKSMTVNADLGKITAEVKGNYGTYTVDIEIDEDKKLDYYCDCPYEGYGCKHIVAVLYKWINEMKSFNKAKEQQMPKKGISKIDIKEIENSKSKEDLLRAIEMVKKDQVDIASIDEKTITANVKTKTNNRVIIRAPDPNYLYSKFNKECTCSNSWDSNPCDHITAVLLKVFFHNDKNHAFLDYESKLATELQKEKYKLLIRKLDFDNHEEEDEKREKQKYHFFFSIEKEREELYIYLKKCKILKNNSLGRSSRTNKKFIEPYKDEFSKIKRRAVEVFIDSLDSGSYYGYSETESIVKKKFEKGLDFEVLRYLRKLYSAEPNCFAGAIFENEKADVNINIIEHKKSNNYVFKIMLQTGRKTYNFNNRNIQIMGKNPLWACIYSKTENKEIIFEINCAYPQMLRNLAKQSNTQITQKQLKRFIEKYYLKLSDIGEVILPEKYSVSEKTLQPLPRLYLKDYADVFSIELRHLYGTEEVKHGTNQDIVYRDKKDKLVKIKRNKEEEKELYSVLLDNYTREKDNCLIPSTDPYVWLADISKNLISQGYEIFGENTLFNQRICEDDLNLKLEVSSGIDWFDLHGDASFGKEKVPFDKLLGALTNNEKFIKLSDGRMGKIPKKWLNKLSGVVGFLDCKEGEKSAKASRSQIEIVEALLDIADTAKTDKKFKEIKEKFRHFRQINDVKLPAGLKGEPRDYQKAGYNWLHFLKEFSFGGCLADEMGLGKTFQVLSFLLYEKEQGNNTCSLIVVPTSLVFNWVNEIKKFTPGLSIYVYHGQKRQKNISKITDKYDLIITTYGTLRNDIDIFSKIEFYYAILDESQQIKNPLSGVAKSAYMINAKHRLVLTGTPVENSTLDLWSQFAFLNPGFLGNMDYFKNNFAKSIEKEKNKDKMSSLKNMINPFLLSRKKQMVARDLPEKQITVLYCEMEDKQRKIYDYWKEKFREEIKESIEENGFMQSRMKILQGLMKLRQICNHPILVDESYLGESGKFNLLINQIEEVIGEGHKVLIYSSFVKMLHVFKDYFEKHDIEFSYLDGSTRKRQEVVEEFQDNEKINAFLISLKAGGLGLNLTAADYVFIVDPWWNPAAEMQAIDRTHRIGQKNNIFVYKAITKDSVEEKILELQESKLELVKNIITIDEGIFKKLNREDIKMMFK